MAQAASDDGQRRLAAALADAAKGERSSFNRIYGLTSAKLFGICLRICRDREAAEDVLNEVYLTVWRRAGSYDGTRGKPMTWLCALTRNRAIDWIRSNGRPMESSDILETFASDEPSPEASASAAQEGRRLQHCLDGLGDDQRSAIRSAFFDGMTYAELADQKAMPLGTMKSWVRRGLLKLKDCLNGE